MNKEEFLKQLDSLLDCIPAEEKEEALSFYRNYFEDAGNENEATVIKELGSPERVAKTIKADLVANGEYSKDGEYTERGYKDADENKESIIKVEPSVHEEKLQAEGSNKENQQSHQQNQGQQQWQNQKQWQNQQYRNGYQQGYAPQQVQVVQKTNVGLLILICILAFPIIIPFTCAAFGIMFGLTVGFGAAGVGCIAGGVIAFVAGIMKIGILPGLGIIAAGAGMICFGIGLLFVCLSVLCARAFPAICKAIIAIFKAPFETRRVIA